MNPSSGNGRNNAEKINLFRLRFSGLEHVYGTYDPISGRAWQEKQNVTDKVIWKHLCGHAPFGVYLLKRDIATSFVADFDNGRLDDAVALVERAHVDRISLYIERSKSKGYHVWMFMEAPVLAVIGRQYLMQHLANMGLESTEVFPKQDEIDVDQGSYGNYINAPLFGALVPQGRTVFLDPSLDYTPYSDQWDFLESLNTIKSADLPEPMVPTTSESVLKKLRNSGIGTFENLGALPPCARNMLEFGVTDNQRVSCFRLAVNLRRVGLNYESTLAVLFDWVRKNRPSQGRRILTDTEIKAQAAHAYLKEYLGYGCEDPAVAPFCQTHCPIYNSLQLQS